jgi:hypothetical protein
VRQWARGTASAAAQLEVRCTTARPRQAKSSDGSAYLFDESAVRDFYLTIPQASIDGMNAQAYPPGCVPFNRDYYTADLTFEDQALGGVGVHIKGGCGSSRDFSGKPSFKIDIDWDDPALAGCPSERRLLGQKHVTLNNGVQDHSAAHEPWRLRAARSVCPRPASRTHACS